MPQEQPRIRRLDARHSIQPGQGNPSQLAGTDSTGGREERVLKERDRQDLKEESSGFYVARSERRGHSVPMSGSRAGYSGTSMSSGSKFCLRELTWNAEPAVYLPVTLAGIANLRPYFLSRSCRVASNFSGPITCT